MTLKKKFNQSPSVEETGMRQLPFHDDPVFFKQLLSHIGDEFIILDSNGKIIFVNNAAVEGFGYSRQYILRKNIFDFFSKKISFNQWKARYFDPLKKAGGEPVSYHLERKSKGGDVRIMDIKAVYACYDNREFILSVGRDVTRQIQLQRSLHESKNLYRFLTEGAREGIAAVDINGRFIYANPALQEMIGLTHGEYRDKHFLEFIHKTSLKKATEIFAKAKKGAQLIHEDIEAITTRDEVIPLELSVTPLMKSGEVINIHLIVRDLRPRQAIKQMERQNEKMDALRYFIAGTAQELRNPLMAVARRADGLLKKYSDRDFEYVSFNDFKDIFSSLEAIRDQIQYCFETSHRLMAMGQKRNGIARHHCNPNKVIQNVLADKETYIHQYEVQVRTQLTTRAIDVRMGAIDFMQILHNLIDNAVQAMPSGGLLTIKTETSSKDNSFVLKVRDQGVGIPEEQISHIFEPFFTTKARGLRKNSGLGLPIVHSLVQAVQGQVQVSSSLRKGTLIKISLPILKFHNKQNS